MQSVIDRYTHERMEISDTCFIQIITGFTSEGEVITSVRLCTEEYVNTGRRSQGVQSFICSLPYGNEPEDLEEMDKLIAALMELRTRAESGISEHE